MNKFTNVLLITSFMLCSSCSPAPQQKTVTPNDGLPKPTNTIYLPKPAVTRTPTVTSEKNEITKPAPEIVFQPFPQNMIGKLVPITESNVNELKEIGILELGEDPIYSMDISEDTHYLVGMNTQDNQLNVILWDLWTGKQVYKMIVPADPDDFGGAFNNIIFSPDHSLFAIGLMDGFVYVFDTNKGELKVKLGADFSITGFVSSIAFSPKGNTLAAAYEDDKSVRVWDIGKKTQSRIFYAIPCGSISLEYSPDGNTIASGSGIGTLNAFDLQDGSSFSYVRDLPKHAEGIQNFTYVAYEKNTNNLLIAKLNTGTIQIWDDFPNGSPKQVLLGGDEDHGDEIHFSADGKMMISQTMQSVSIWMLPSGKKVKSLEISTANSKWISKAVLSKDSRLLIVTSNEGRQVRFWGVIE